MDTENDWQDTVMKHRHNHNRIAKKDRSSKGGGGFDARKTLGSFKIECRSYTKMIKGDQSREPTFEIFGFTKDGQGLTGQIDFPGVLRASIIFAGSRRTLNKIISSLEQATKDEDDITHEDQVEDEDDIGDNADDHDVDAIGEEKKQNFEKNSFRSPKFWIRWQGELLNPASFPSSNGDDAIEMNSGYIVFSGNDCRKFSGTLSSKKLGWDNAAFNGWKIKSMTERDVEPWSTNPC